MIDMNQFWVGFEKRAIALPKVGITRGLFSKGGIQQAVKHNPLPGTAMKPTALSGVKRISGHGAGSMPIP